LPEDRTRLLESSIELPKQNNINIEEESS